MEHEFNWFSLIPFIKSQPIHVITSLFVLFLLFFFSWWVKRSIARSSDPLIPKPKANLTNIFEIIIEYLLGLIRNIIGPHSERFLPLIGTLFIYILTCNLLGLIPGFLSPTSNINTNAACAIIVFVMYNMYGFQKHGIKYLKQFSGPILWLAPLMFVIEFLSHLFRPFSLSIRLFGNIFGDHLILGIFSGLVPIFVPVIFLVLGLAVAIIQALVFALLATVYIGLAVTAEH